MTLFWKTLHKSLANTYQSILRKNKNKSFYAHSQAAMNSSSETTTEDHILLLPFLAQGHLRPTLHLAQLLQTHSHFTITILTTPLNAASTRRLADKHSFHVNVVDLPFNSIDHGLPPNVENTQKLPLNSMISFCNATISLEPHLRDYITRHHSHQPPLCIIFDVLLGWVKTVAQSIGSTGICFNTGGAYGVAAYMSMWINLPHRNVSDEEEFSLPWFPEDTKFRRNQFHRFLRFVDGSDDWSRFLQPQIKLSMSCSGWLCNSVEEVEKLGFEIMRNQLNSPQWGVGSLIMDPDNDKNRICDDQTYIEWLNQFEKDSVLYISFGSQNTVSPNQMMELAKGLELSEVSFLWVIRPPFGFDINAEFKPEWLPEGFEERMMESNQGKLVHKWGPQLEILNHRATGAFLSHCGWNSVLEALRKGVPIIGWPLAAEQPYNSKMLVEDMGVAVELTRGLEGKVKEEGVKRLVQMVMDKKEGSCGLEMKRKAAEIGKKLRDALRKEGDYKGSSLRVLDDFVEFLVSRRG